MNRAQQNPAFAKNVGFVLRFERRLKNDGRANGDCPTQRVIRGLAIHVLLDSETGIDPRAVDALALFIEAANGRPHAFGTYPNDIDVFREIIPYIAQMSQQKAMRETQSRIETKRLE